MNKQAFEFFYLNKFCSHAGHFSEPLASRRPITQVYNKFKIKMSSILIFFLLNYLEFYRHKSNEKNVCFLYFFPSINSIVLKI